MFVFSAQQEAKVNEVMKEKPPDPFFNAKRARAQEDLDDNLLRKSSDSFKSKLLGHSKEACKEGVEEQIKVAEVPVNGDEVSAAGKESFGPWMQVSYGKNGRNTAGGKNFGRKYGNVGNSSGFGAASRSNDVYKTVVLDKTDVAKNSAGKVAVGNSIRPRLGLYQGNRKIGGSRFEILSEDLEENVGTNNYNSRTPKHNKPDPNKILSDISNRGKINGGQSISHSKKVLEVNKSREYLVILLQSKEGLQEVMSLIKVAAVVLICCSFLFSFVLVLFCGSGCFFAGLGCCVFPTVADE
ncbi:hypothetical protein Q3G72_002199 [Acer saccharum]|nr:hypothetical protein Q3G72_002199 [Acer saccharum]